MPGSITFVGAGPGAPDLITLRGAEALKQAEVIIYAGSLVNEQLLELAPVHCRKLNSAAMDLHEVIAEMQAAWDGGLRLVRLHTGDPSIYGAVAEQYRSLDRLGIPYSVIPGVSSVLAAAAAVKTEFTVPGVTQSIILTRDAGRTPVPAEEELTRLAAHGTSLCLFLSVDRIGAIARKLIAAGRAPATPAAVVYRASWPNQKIVRGTLDDIAGAVAAAGIKRQALILVGEALANAGDESLLYRRDFAHGYRDSREERLPRRCSVFAMTAAGADKAAEIAAGLGGDARVAVPEKYAGRIPAMRLDAYPAGGFAAKLSEAWSRGDALVLVMAAGIAVRHLAFLCRDKRQDPAVVVCDEAGNHAISLLSGHLGGANALARRVAGITGGEAVITTATDVRGFTAFDELAKQLTWRIDDDSALAAVTTAMLDGEPVTVAMPEELFARFYAGVPNLSREEPPSPDEITVRAGGKTLRLLRRRFAAGIGCRRGVPEPEIRQDLDRVLKELDIPSDALTLLASAEVKSDEAGLLELGRTLGKEIRFFPAAELNAVAVPHPSEAAKTNLGLNSVSEAAALLAAGADGVLIAPKTVFPRVTIAIAEML